MQWLLYLVKRGGTGYREESGRRRPSILSGRSAGYRRGERVVQGRRQDFSSGAQFSEKLLYPHSFFAI